MFCTKCGKQIPDSTKFCPYCGANCSPEQDIAGQAGQVFNKVEKELGSAFDEVKQSFNGNSNNQNYNQGYNANQNYSNINIMCHLVNEIIAVYSTCDN